MQKARVVAPASAPSIFAHPKARSSPWSFLPVRMHVLREHQFQPALQCYSGKAQDFLAVKCQAEGLILLALSSLFQRHVDAQQGLELLRVHLFRGIHQVSEKLPMGLEYQQRIGRIERLFTVRKADLDDLVVIAHVRYRTELALPVRGIY